MFSSLCKVFGDCVFHALWADIGTVVLQLVFQQNQHITKLDYEESGPTVVHKKCC